MAAVMMDMILLQTGEIEMKPTLEQINAYKAPIGTQYKDSKGGTCTIIDKHTTVNSNLEIVKQRYVAEYILCGQKVIDRDVSCVTVARRIYGVNAE